MCWHGMVAWGHLQAWPGIHALAITASLAFYWLQRRRGCIYMRVCSYECQTGEREVGTFTMRGQERHVGP
jgi:hypothetical protein